MKLFTTICKLLAAAAAIAGAVYVIATYGDRIVAWAKKLMAGCPCHSCTTQAPEEAPAAEEPVEAIVEEAPVEEAPAEETTAEEAVEIPAEVETEPTAEPADFES